MVCWERMAQQLQLQLPVPQQRPAPRMPAFLLSPSQSSQEDQVPKHHAPIPSSLPQPYQLAPSSFTFLSSSINSCEAPSPVKVSPSKLTTVSREGHSASVQGHYHSTITYPPPPSLRGAPQAGPGKVECDLTYPALLPLCVLPSSWTPHNQPATSPASTSLCFHHTCQPGSTGGRTSSPAPLCSSSSSSSSSSSICHHVGSS